MAGTQVLSGLSSSRFIWTNFATSGGKCAGKTGVQPCVFCNRKAGPLALCAAAAARSSTPGGGIQRHEKRGDPAGPVPFTQTACNRAGILQGAQFDASHRDKPWRFWRFACPTPTVNAETGEVVGWHLPDCGHRDIVICETDSVI